MKRYIGLVLLVFLVSCKAKSVLATAGAKNALSADKIIASHYSNNKDFKTLYIKSSAHYEDRRQSQKVTAEIKIKKDEMILVSVRFLGITMAKALITPTQVKYYEKLNGQYFEGDFSSLSKWLGTDLNFQKVQNMLIGNALDDLKIGMYNATIEDQLYKLEGGTDISTRKTYFFEALKYLVKKEHISQRDKSRELQIIYPDYRQYNEISLPTGLLIEATQKGEKTKIDVSYNTVSINEELSFPYSVPDDFERIFIK